VSVEREIEGLYPICKPPGLTSHDVVAAVRRLTGERHAGHSGTLDPAAAGVLLVLVGQGPTRLAEYLLDLRKVYVAEIRFGRTTDTQDYTGRLVAAAPRSEVRRLTAADLEAVLPRFHGALKQVPPMVSAVRMGGRRLYQLAREGQVVERKPRDVFVYSIELLDFAAGSDGPVARLRVACSRGTYVRSLAHDLGRALGIGAHLGFLVREAVGSFEVAATLTLEELAARSAAAELAGVRVAPADAVGHLPAIRLSEPECDRVRRGEMPQYAGGWAGLSSDRQPPGRQASIVAVRVLSEDGDLVAVASLSDGRIRPRKVLKPWIGGSPA
jgi:tRNA pseudouridine55 synthase